MGASNLLPRHLTDAKNAVKLQCDKRSDAETYEGFSSDQGEEVDAKSSRLIKGN